MTAGQGVTAPVVSNASPLIALAHVGRLDVLNLLFGDVVVPRAVANEIGPELPVLPQWLVVVTPTQPLASQVQAPSLGPGERETISLAMEQAAKVVLLDDRPARRLAISLGLNVVGTLGILLACKRRGIVTEVGPVLNDLVAKGFRVAPRLLEQVLRDAGE